MVPEVISLILLSVVATSTQSEAVRCPQNEVLYLPHHDCSRFYYCEEGVGYILKCSDNLHFNLNSNICETPERAKCEETEISDDLINNYYYFDIEENYINEPCEVDEDTNEEPTSEPDDTDDQTEDNENIDDDWVPSDEPCLVEPSTTEETENSKTTIASSTNAEETTIQTTTLETTNSETTQEISTKNDFTTVSDIIPTEAPTHEPETTKEVTTENDVTTELDEIIPTKDIIFEPETTEDITTTLKTTTNTNTESTTVTETESTTIGEPTEEELMELACNQDGRYLAPHPSDCTLFLYCKNGGYIIKHCNDGWHFSPNLGTCKKPEDANCQVK